MALLLIKNGTIQSPYPMGKMDILVAGNKIIAIDSNISEHSVKTLDKDAAIIDANLHWITPGLIDTHIHFNGAGGENGPQFRTPPLQLSSLIRAGITTAVAPMGTDGFSRSLRELLAKSRGLENEGITTYIYTGSYSFPSVSITDNIITDIVLIDKIIGTKIALSDHRSSHLTVEELRRVTSDTRVAGLIAGKAGKVEVHMGSEEQGLTLIEKAVEGTEIPLTQLRPTHVNRNRNLFNQTIDFCAKGGVADITTSMNDAAVATSECFDQILNSKAPLSQFTLSTDGNGSMPVFNDAGDLVRMGTGEVSTLLTALRDIIANDKNSINDVLPLVTENAAKRLNLEKKGTLKTGNDADILIFSPSNLELQYVVSQGRIMMQEGELVQYGTFETPDSTK